MCSIDSGESHKIVLKRPLVHYIWWGNPKAGIGKGDEYLANAVTTPNIMAGIKNIKVMYWRQSGANDLRKKLNSKIVQYRSYLRTQRAIRCRNLWNKVF